MIDEKIREELVQYREALLRLGVAPHKYPHDSYMTSSQKDAALSYCLDMINDFLDLKDKGIDDYTESSMSFLGFIQGVFWCHSIYSYKALLFHDLPIMQILVDNDPDRWNPKNKTVSPPSDPGDLPQKTC